MSKKDPFKYYKTSPEIIKLAVMYYVRYPLSLRQVEDILHERGIDVCHEKIRYWWNKFSTLFSKEVKKKTHHRASNGRWHSAVRQTLTFLQKHSLPKLRNTNPAPLLN
jgi:putative transposase